MAKKPTLAVALKALQANLTSRTSIPEEHMVVLRETLGGRRVLTLSGTTLDIDQIESDVAHLDLSGDDSAGDDLKTLDEAMQSARPALPACPVTGQSLRLVKGKNGQPDQLLTKDKIDWQPLTTEQREVAAYAVSIGAITPTSTSAESAAYNLRQNPLPPPWPRLTSAWVALRDKPKKTPAEAAQVASVQARLTFQRQEAPAAAGSSFPAETVSAQPEPAPAPSARQDMAPTTTGAPLLYIKAHSSDLPWVARLRSHLTLMERRGGVEVFDETQIPPGATRSDLIARNLRRAAVVLYLVSSDMLATIDVAAVKAAAAQARHIPFLVRPSFGMGEAFGGSVALPRNGVPASKWSDNDSCAAEVVGELRAVIESLGRTQR